MTVLINWDVLIHHYSSLYSKISINPRLLYSSDEKTCFLLNRKDQALQELVEASDKRCLARWALACADRVLPYFEVEFPVDADPGRL